MIVAAGIALAGCQTGPAAWTKPGVSVAQAEQDFKLCDYEGEKATQESGVAGGLRVVRLRDQCMDLKGYARKG